MDIAKKVLEGNLVALKQQFKNHQFEIVMESDSDPRTFLLNSDQFSLMDVNQMNNQYHLLVQLHEQISGNQLLQLILPYGNLVTFKEVLPTMNEIFIKQVNETK